jgi:hypothetical protein
MHAVVFYAVGRVPWAATELQPSTKPMAVWLDERALRDRPPKPEPPPDPPAEPPPAEQPPATAAVPPPEPVPAPEESPPRPRAVAPTPPPAERAAESAEEPRPPPETVAPPAPAPRIDWEKQRRDAARAVLEDREREGEYLTFSLEDIEEPEVQKVDPAPKPMVTDNCVITSNKWARMAAMMIGRCVREARGDLFADAMPLYMKARPVCTETQPESPGAVTSTGEVISTVKCELVAEEEEEAE